jgi:hypothetical protein
MYMRKVTFKADSSVIEEARLVARAQGRTLEDAFREWLAEFAGMSRDLKKLEALMKRLRYVKSHGPYTRDEMHER